MEEKGLAFPEWVTDKELFANYMEDISHEWSPPFFKKPFPESWDAPAVKQFVPPPEREKESSLSSLVGLLWREFIDDMRFWLS